MCQQSCPTLKAQRCLQVWLTQPLVDLAAITARHDIVEAFVTDLELRERLRDQSLRGALAVALSRCQHRRNLMDAT